MLSFQELNAIEVDLNHKMSAVTTANAQLQQTVRTSNLVQLVADARHDPAATPRNASAAVPPTEFNDQDRKMLEVRSNVIFSFNKVSCNAHHTKIKASKNCNEYA